MSGRIIKMHMTKRALSYRTAAEFIGIDKSLLHCIASGKQSDIMISVAVKICDAFELTMDELAQSLFEK